MGAHQGFPEAAVIGHREVQEFVNNHVVPELWIEGQEIGAEVQLPSGGARGPLVAHGAHGKPGDRHLQLLGPVVHALLEGMFGAEAHSNLVPLVRVEKRASTRGVT